MGHPQSLSQIAFGNRHTRSCLLSGIGRGCVQMGAVRIGEHCGRIGPDCILWGSWCYCHHDSAWLRGRDAGCSSIRGIVMVAVCSVASDAWLPERQMTSLRELQRNWEGLAQTDPLWSICTDPEKRNKGWNQDEFFATGKHEIEK